MRLGTNEITERLRMSRAQFAPLQIVSIEKDMARAEGLSADALIRFEVPDGPCFGALADVISVASPKRIARRCALLVELCRSRSDPDLVPMIVAPYVPTKQAATLAQSGVSWLDLSGNMVIHLSGRVYIERTGQPNQFPDTAPIKKVFQGTASLVSRALLLEPSGFASLSEIANFIKERDATIALSTISKVLQSLEEDLLIARKGRSISTSEPGELLDRLAQGYADSCRGSRASVSHFAMADVENTLKRLPSSSDGAYVICGFHAAKLLDLAVSSEAAIRVKNTTVFCEVVRRLGSDIEKDDEFGNLRVAETRSPLFWFNAQTVKGLRVVDDLQLYLEMTVATPRGPKVADALRRRILREPSNG